jgi:hypothetical protein
MVTQAVPAPWQRLFVGVEDVHEREGDEEDKEEGKGDHGELGSAENPFGLTILLGLVGMSAHTPDVNLTSLRFLRSLSLSLGLLVIHRRPFCIKLRIGDFLAISFGSLFALRVSSSLELRLSDLAQPNLDDAVDIDVLGDVLCSSSRRSTREGRAEAFLDKGGDWFGVEGRESGRRLQGS